MVRSSLTRSSLTLITDWLSGKGIMGQNWTSASFDVRWAACASMIACSTKSVLSSLKS